MTSTTGARHLTAGDRVGSYVLGEHLGSGGNCDVYRARQEGLDRDVAIKLQKPDVAAAANERRRFLREARTCAGLDHPAILPVYEVGEHEGRPYLVMPYVAAGTLADRLERGLAPAEGLALLVAVAEALACAHERGIIHRDLKPENVLVTEDGEAKVADWGLARPVEDVEHLTKTGMVLGTPQYMAPEAILGKPLTARTDLYSLGLMIFEVLTGRQAFGGLSMHQTVRAQLDRPPPSLAQECPSAPEPVVDLVAALLAKNPDDRPGSASAVAAVLRQAAARRDEPSGEPYRRSTTSHTAPTIATSHVAMTAHRPTRSAERRRLVPWKAVAVLVAIAAVLVLALALRRTDRPYDFIARRARLNRLDAIDLLFDAPSPPHCRAEFATPSAAGPPPLPPMDLPMDRAQSLGGGRYALTVSLPRPIVRPTPLRLFVGAGAPAADPTTGLPLDPSPAVSALLAPFDAVGADEYARLVQHLDTLTSARPPRVPAELERFQREQQSAYAAILEDAGLGPTETMATLGRLVPDLLGDATTAFSPVARRLHVVRAVRSMTTASPYLPCPLVAAADRLGVTVGPFAPPRSVPTGWAAVSSLRTVTPGVDHQTHDGRRGPDCLWLVSSKPSKGSSSGTIARIMFRGYLDKVDTTHTCRLEAVAAATDMPWPPPTAFLDVFMFRFDTRERLLVGIDDGPFVPVYDTRQTQRRRVFTDDFDGAVASLRLGPEDLRSPTPQVTLRLEQLPHARVVQFIGIFELVLRVPAQRR